MDVWRANSLASRAGGRVGAAAPTVKRTTQAPARRKKHSLNRRRPQRAGGGAGGAQARTRRRSRPTRPDAPKTDCRRKGKDRFVVASGVGAWGALHAQKGSVRRGMQIVRGGQGQSYNLRTRRALKARPAMSGPVWLNTTDLSVATHTHPHPP